VNIAPQSVALTWRTAILRPLRGSHQAQEVTRAHSNQPCTNQISRSNDMQQIQDMICLRCGHDNLS
jgi:hypothetical protein